MKEQNDIVRGVWQNHSDEAYRRDQSHWRGEGRWADDEAWQNIGRTSLDRLRAFYRYLDRPFPESPTVLEWGPGGGANLHAFRTLAPVYFGVDIAQSNLDEAARMIGNQADATVRFKSVYLDGDPASVAELVTRPVDIFLTTAVFQHFPSQEYGVRVLRAVKRLCAKDAVGMIHIRYHDGNPKFAPLERLDDYQDRHIQANSYELASFVDILRAEGFGFAYFANMRTQNNSVTAFVHA